MTATAEIQVFARVLGSYQWMCPNCGYMHTSTQVHWRRARIRCWHCKRRYMVGLIFMAHPTNSQFMGIYNGHTVNLLKQYALGGHIIAAKAIGSCDWCCPTCSQVQNSKVPWDQCVTCCQCRCTWYVGVLLWSISKGYHPNRTPHDCVPPLGWRLDVQKSTGKRPSAATLS